MNMEPTKIGFFLILVKLSHFAEIAETLWRKSLLLPLGSSGIAQCGILDNSRWKKDRIVVSQKEILKSRVVPCNNPSEGTMTAATIIPLVTVAIPTYNRPALLSRALFCLCSQGYPNIEVLVADNCSPGEEVPLVIESFRYKLPSLKYVRHAQNIGPMNNFLSLLDRANGKYFMWLADDDEISPNYVSALTQLLENNPEAATAAGHWVLLFSKDRKVYMPTTSLPQRSAIMRATRFIWDADDAFFYGLHKTELLRKATFKTYWWPNKNVMFNYAHVFLLDMVLSGRVLLPRDSSVQFINHNYTAKDYSFPQNKLNGLFLYLMRRINVHFFYLIKVGRTLGPVVVAPMIIVSLLSILREFSLFFGGVIYRKISRPEWWK